VLETEARRGDYEITFHLGGAGGHRGRRWKRPQGGYGAFSESLKEGRDYTRYNPRKKWHFRGGVGSRLRKIVKREGKEQFYMREGSFITHTAHKGDLFKKELTNPFELEENKKSGVNKGCGESGGGTPAEETAFGHCVFHEIIQRGKHG